MRRPMGAYTRSWEVADQSLIIVNFCTAGLMGPMAKPATVSWLDERKRSVGEN
jgi:uncharacterized membrane protein YjgN (DUF898 family)